MTYRPDDALSISACPSAKAARAKFLRPPCGYSLDQCLFLAREVRSSPDEDFMSMLTPSSLIFQSPELKKGISVSVASGLLRFISVAAGDCFSILNRLRRRGGSSTISITSLVSSKIVLSVTRESSGEKLGSLSCMRSLASAVLAAGTQCLSA
jgi:hypothetical protein